MAATESTQRGAASRRKTSHIVLDGEPGGLSHACFRYSGPEGSEAALKLARQYFVEISETQQVRFIARCQGYHGNTLGALAAGGNMMWCALWVRRAACGVRRAACGVAIYSMGGTINGSRGDHVLIAPPYIASAADIDMIVDRLGAAIGAAPA